MRRFLVDNQLPAALARLGNCRTPVLLGTLERAWPTITEQLDAGARLIEVF